MKKKLFIASGIIMLIAVALSILWMGGNSGTFDKTISIWNFR